MNEQNGVHGAHSGLTGDPGTVEYSPGKYREEAGAFLRQCLDAELYKSIMSSADGRSRPYVAARVFLSDAQWAKYVWIEQHGSLDGFAE